MCAMVKSMALLVLVVSFLNGELVHAQVNVALTDRDPDSVFKFNLSPPGARSLAMGGAFIALADDATAAYTNPAGLTNLTLGGSEVALEVRQLRFTNSFVDGGHISAIPGTPAHISGTGVDVGGGPMRDQPGLVRDQTSSKLSGLSFLSFGWVLPRGLTLAFYRHELANFEASYESQGPFVDVQPDLLGGGQDFFDLDNDGDTQELFCNAVFDFDITQFSLSPQTPQGLCPTRGSSIYPKRSRTNLEIVNYGISAAFEFKLPLGGFESALSVGFGVSYYELELDGRVEFFSVDRSSLYPNSNCPLSTDPECRQPGRFYGPPDFTPDNLGFLDEERGDEDDVGFSLGFLWKLGRQQRWSVGGVFRQGPEFETEVTLDSHFIPNPDLIDAAVTIPDVYGLGAAYRSAGGKTKITLDVNQVRYSQRLVDFLGEEDLADPEIASLFRIEDADEIHLGFERIILVVESLFVGTARFGVWNEPFHELEYIGPESTDLRREISRQTLSRPADDELHFSLGLGLVIKEDYQIDLAADLSDLADTYSFSLVKFF